MRSMSVKFKVLNKRKPQLIGDTYELCLSELTVVADGEKECVLNDW